MKFLIVELSPLTSLRFKHSPQDPVFYLLEYLKTNLRLDPTHSITPYAMILGRGAFLGQYKGPVPTSIMMLQKLAIIHT